MVITLLEPLEEVEGESLNIVCQVLGGGAQSLAMKEDIGGGKQVTLNTAVESRFRSRMYNSTHKEFILSPLRREDTGRSFTCDFEEFSSKPYILMVSCKLGFNSNVFMHVI